MTLTITLIIIIITVLVSIAAFSNDKIYNDLIFYPPAVTHKKQWYRFFTCGFIHADYGHLALNMYAFYIFGQHVEGSFQDIFYEKGKILYLLMYVTSLFFCLLPTYSQHKEDSHYRSLGASGAVSAVIFAYILLDPLQKIGLIFLPPQLGLPGFVFGLLYLVISSYLDKRGGGNINHSAHIWGALYGVVFLIAASNFFSSYPVLQNFVADVRSWLGSF